LKEGKQTAQRLFRSTFISIPSLILVTPSGEIYAGNEAANHPDRYTGNNVTVSPVKRLIGRQGETEWDWWTAHPQVVYALILAEVKKHAEAYLGEEIHEAVIGVPSHFDESQRQATKEGAAIAGLEVLRLLNEATASVLAYGSRLEGDGKALAVDLGGGTLDISGLEYGDGVYEVKSVEGESSLGGDDFDILLVDHILQTAFFTTYEELDGTKRLLLKEFAERAKIELSSVTNTTIYIPGFLSTETGYKDLHVKIDRDTFEKLSAPLCERILAVTKQALEEAGLQPEDSDTVLLLDGGSRIPRIRKTVMNLFGGQPLYPAYRETCVAEGVVAQAAVLTKQLKDVLLLDVTPCSLGLGMADDAFTRMIGKNSTIPTRKSGIFSTTEDNQTAISFPVYQGENEVASKNTFLGNIELTGIPPVPAGVPQIGITFNVDANFIIHVQAKDLGTGKEQTVRLSPVGLNAEQIKLLRERFKGR